MKMLAILALTVLGFYLLTIQWGILSVGCAVGVWLLIRNDKGDQIINSFFSLCAGVIVLGGILALFGIIA